VFLPDVFGNVDELELKADSMYLRLSIMSGIFSIHIDGEFLSELWQY